MVIVRLCLANTTHLALECGSSGQVKQRQIHYIKDSSQQTWAKYLCIITIQNTGSMVVMYLMATDKRSEAEVPTEIMNDWFHGGQKKLMELIVISFI